MVTDTNSLAITVRSTSSVLDDCTYRLFNINWVIAFRRNVFNIEKDLSAVAVAMGNVK